MPVDLANRVYQLFLTGLDWLYPPDCCGCGKSGVHWCEDCQSRSHVIGNDCCEVCGDISVPKGVCKRCQSEKPDFTSVRSWATYEGPIRNTVRRLKYKGDFSLGASLAKLMIPALQATKWPVDIVMPVPLSLARLSERGYNQAALIARFIAAGLQVPYVEKGLIKVRNTRSQVGLQFEERKANVVGAFEAVEEHATGKRILVIDDVTTSGSTLRECAKALKHAGSSDVYGYTFARAIYNHPNADADVQMDLM
jgi:competence protein ComFC